MLLNKGNKNGIMNNDEIDWEDLYLRLYSYTTYLVRSKGWFRGNRTDSFLKGKQIHDYVSGAIEKYLSHPEKFDPSRGRSLEKYLKLHIIKTLVGNDARSPENKTSSNIFNENPFGDEEANSNYLDNLLPYLEVYYDDEIDYKLIISSIMDEIKEDKIAENIFLGRIEGLLRRDIIYEFGISAKEYDNGNRRLETIINNVVDKFKITK